MTAVIVLGYGCDIGTVRGYLDWAAEEISAIPGEVIVITSGGFTNPGQFPGISEAGMMAGYLQGLGLSAEIVREELAATTEENLRNCFSVIENWRVRHIVVLCDSARRWRVVFLAKRIFATKRVEVRGFDFCRPLRERMRRRPRRRLGMRTPP